ncbi:MAG: hypothetical protein R3C45_16225 [Phycisphaerales bacterium]
MAGKGKPPQPPSPFIRDMIINRLIDRWDLSLITVWFGAAVLPMLCLALLACFTGNLWTVGDRIGFFNDYCLLNSLLLGVPSTVVFYCLWPRFLKTCLDQLRENGVLGDPRPDAAQESGVGEDIQAFVGRVSKALSSWKLTVLSMTASAIFLTVVISDHMQSKSWIMAQRLAFLLVESLWFVMFTMGFLLFFRIFVGLWWIDQTFKRFYLVFRPLHPDQFGGLRPVSQLSLKLGVIICVVGLQFSTNQFTTNYIRTASLGGMAWSIDIIIPWVLYIIVVPIAFYAPIWTAHINMKSTKHAELCAIADLFNDEYRTRVQGLRDNTPTTEGESDRIAEIKRLYEIVYAYPVWPFPFHKFLQFFGVVLLPLALSAATTYLELLTTKVFGD